MPGAETAARLVSTGLQRGLESACLLWKRSVGADFKEWQQGIDAIVPSIRHGIAFGGGANMAETT